MTSEQLHRREKGFQGHERWGSHALDPFGSSVPGVVVCEAFVVSGSTHMEQVLPSAEPHKCGVCFSIFPIQNVHLKGLQRNAQPTKPHFDDSSQASLGFKPPPLIPQSGCKQMDHTLHSRCPQQPAHNATRHAQTCCPAYFELLNHSGAE